MRKPLPCQSCIIFPICRSIYNRFQPSRRYIEIQNIKAGYDVRFLHPLCNRCSILKQYFNNYLKHETYEYRLNLLINYYQNPTENIKDE